MPDKFYLTTPIYYVNARPHIGHAYSTIVCDVIARRHRLLGDDVFFLTGTDEHGQKIERSAKAAGKSPQAFADEVSAQFYGLWKRMGLIDDSFSKSDPLFHRDYIRTTEPRHKQGVQKLFTTLRDNGFIEKKMYSGQYCVSDEAFVDVAPGAPCPLCGRPTETVSEENYYFKLSEFQEKLLDYYDAHPDFIAPDGVRNEVLSFVRGSFADGDPNVRLTPGGVPNLPGALKDLSISRTSFDWGIPVPGDEKHVIYVWLDALANYMTAVGYGDPTREETDFKKWWPADLHLIGKEISRFHCVYWPAFLMAAGLPLPKRVVANGWLLFEESKMSKSRGNIVRTETILDAFGALKPDLPKAEQDLFAADVLRYFLLREIPFGQDGSFSFDALVQRYNSDLANGYGNLVSRTLALIQKLSNSMIPKYTKSIPGSPDHFDEYFFGVISGPGRMAFSDEINKQHFRLTFSGGSLGNGFDKFFAKFGFTQAIENIWWAISGTDSLLSRYVPWKMVEGPDRDKVLYEAAESIRIITALIYPVMPYAASKVWAQLGLGDIEEAARKGELKNLQRGGLKPGTKLGPLGPIFPRADKEIINRMNELEQNNSPKLSETSAASSAPEAAPRTTTMEAPAAAGAATATQVSEARPGAPASEAAKISIDDFTKVELRVAKILVAERVPKADKLLRLEVDLGYEQRQILAGIAETYTPEQLIGRKVVIVANLAPRKLRGLESNGMIVAASVGEAGTPCARRIS
jgi:methionyl-tRNA synthetase